MRPAQIGTLEMTTFDKREEGFEKKFAIDEEQRSEDCLPIIIFWSTGLGAAVHPRRTPGERILENVEA